jgi:hypothetical protein
MKANQHALTVIILFCLVTASRGTKSCVLVLLSHVVVLSLLKTDLGLGGVFCVCCCARYTRRIQPYPPSHS